MLIAKSYGLLAVISVVLCAPVYADPPVSTKIPPPVFCWKPTAASQNGAGITLQFEVLNWTNEKAYDLELGYNAGLSTGGTFGAAGTAPGPFSGKINLNDWSADLGASTATSARWIAGTPLMSLNPNLPPLPSPIDSGMNTLDGFLLTLPGLNPYERIVMDWSLSDVNGGRIQDDNGGFSFGVVQIDRAADGPNGEVRLSQFFWAGWTTAEIPLPGPLLDRGLTDARAQSLPVVVPVPAAVWLFGSALLGLFGIARRAKRNSIALA